MGDGGAYEVIIAGGGPTGLMLAGELALAGVDVAIVERRQSQALVGLRAGGLHARTLEVFDQRGIAERFLAEGQKVQAAGFAGVQFNLAGFPTRHPYSLGLRQPRVEQLLAGWVEGELKVPVLRGAVVAGFDHDEDGVDVALDDGRRLRAAYLVGCDGGRSRVRKAAGIGFPGTDAATSNIIAEAELADPPAEWGVRRDAMGTHALGRVDYEVRDGRIVYADHGPVGILVTEREIGTGEPTLEDLRAAMIAVYGTDYGLHSPTWISRFTDAARQAETYRKGRVLLAGDAAHTHPPDGGQGLQTGVQDAVNLGWKLAQVVRGVSHDSLLDSYYAERHPVGARVLRNTLAAVGLRKEDDRTSALRAVVAEMLEGEEAQRRIAAMLTGLDVAYDLGEGHPLLGRRMPDLDLVTGSGEARVYDLLHEARPVLLDLGGLGGFEAGPWADRVRLFRARYQGPWRLPAIGEVAAPKAVLIRPDGYVAWVGAGEATGLIEALIRWFGSAAADQA